MQRDITTADDRHASSVSSSSVKEPGAGALTLGALRAFAFSFWKALFGGFYVVLPAVWMLLGGWGGVEQIHGD